MTRHLTLNRDVYCDSWEEWGGADYLAHLGRTFDTSPVYVAGDAPKRRDPYRLDHLCTESEAQIDAEIDSERDTAAQ